MDLVLGELRAVAEPTRLRILAALTSGELTVTELVQILNQSQPRVSRHLKTLMEAGIIERLPEGAWAYYRFTDLSDRPLIQTVLSALPDDDFTLRRDSERRREVIAARSEAAARFFRTVAQDWDRVRALQTDDALIVDAMREAAGAGPFDLHIDLGTGTGAMLTAFADRARRGIGVDRSHDMLTVARSKLQGDASGLRSVQYCDVTDLPFSDGAADLVTIHHVLHYLADPRLAVREAVRVLKPGGTLLIVDFAPHGHDFMREEYAHTRLGFAAEEIGDWLRHAGAPDWSVTTFPGSNDQGLAVSLWKATAETGNLSMQGKVMGL